MSGDRGGGGGEHWGIIVDDKPPQATSIARNLTLRGLPSQAFLDPEDALAFARTHHGSVVFAMFDVCLGKKSGPEYARRFREERLAHDIALMTAYEEQLPTAELEQLKNLGILIYQKPVSLEKLSREVLHKWFEPAVEDPPKSQPSQTQELQPPRKPPEAGSDTGGGHKPLVKKPSLVRRIAVGAAVVTAVVALAVFTFRMVARVRSGKVIVPESHFVGKHGKNKRVIVFVHGVMGDMQNTWVNSETQAYWPEMIKEDDAFQDFDVFVYGYSSPAFGRASDIEDIAKRFGQQLQDGGMFSNYDEIDFITHSMGGIVTKRMLNMLNNTSDIGKLRRVHSVIYISVPSNGADLANLATWLSLNPQFKSMSRKDAADFLNSVEDDWAKLLRDRSANARFPRSFSAYETLPMDGIMVVPKLYTSQLSDGSIMAFDYNHADIVKPRSSESDVYKWVAARIKEASSVGSAANPYP
jgi:pimeloyl-ACP methyl ester carboxylesterase/ActR/RegA family two-component response regulator